MHLLNELQTEGVVGKLDVSPLDALSLVLRLVRQYCAVIAVSNVENSKAVTS